MITIHQATFGDKAGGYALLVSSFDDDSIPKRIGNSTDVHDRPVGEVLSEHIDRGFPIDDYYLIVRSFPHVEEGIRSGRVFSHALFIEKSDIEKVSNLKGLLNLLMREISLNAANLPIQFDEKIALLESNMPVKGRAAYGIKGLLNHGEFSDTIAWVGKVGFFDFLCQIWAGFPIHLRKEIFFGAAFDPRKVKGESLKIVHVDQELAFKWKKSGFLVVEESSEAELKKESEFYLAGNKIRASSLESLIEKFKLQYDQISDLTILEKVLTTFQRMDSDAKLGDLVLFSDLISKFNPNPLSATGEKKRLLLQLTKRLAYSNAHEIIALRNVNWSGFSIPELEIRHALEDWGKHAVIEGKNRKEIPKVIALAFLEPKADAGWWCTAIQIGVISALKNWASNHARVIWEWIQFEPRLVAFLSDIAKLNIPRQVDLLEQLPVLEESTSVEIISLCKKMHWMLLHGKLLARIIPIEQALNRQLEIDTDPNHLDALRLMSKESSDNEFVLSAIRIGDNRLLDISGEMVNKDTRLLENLDIQNQNWREIWLKAILKGAQPWNGVSDPPKRMEELMSLLVGKEKINAKLLDSIAHTPYSDLSIFNARNEVWSLLPISSRDIYLSSTARACIVRFDKEDFPISSLEKPLADKIADIDFFSSIAMNQSIKLSSKIALFYHVPTIGSNHLQMVLEYNRFDSLNATNIGNLILNRDWSKAARFLFQKVSDRKDFVIALSLCYSLLNIFDRIVVRQSGYANVVINSEDWFNALAETCMELLVKGPSQNGIWEHCGGKTSDLLVSSTGKETWIHALDQIKKGNADFKIDKLMSELRKEFPTNEKLKMLEEARPK